jgi:hypothetical protein
METPAGIALRFAESVQLRRYHQVVSLFVASASGQARKHFDSNELQIGLSD